LKKLPMARPSRKIISPAKLPHSLREAIFIAFLSHHQPQHRLVGEKADCLQQACCSTRQGQKTIVDICKRFIQKNKISDLRLKRNRSHLPGIQQ
jgi:hypothetical protein